MEAGQRRRLWKAEYDSGDPLLIGEAAEDYAEWVRNGKEGEQVEPSTFLPCIEFNGSKFGWPFKQGAVGLGYYKDGVPEKDVLDLASKLWPTANVEPVIAGQAVRQWRVL